METIDAETGIMNINNVKEDAPLSFDDILAYLPQHVNAVVDGAEEALALTWSCDSFPEQASSGEYVFDAALPEGYVPAEGVAALHLTVVLSEAESTKSVSAWSWMDDFEIIDPELNLATIPGVSADNPIDYDTLVEFLPMYVTATVDGVEETLALTWSCENFPETATGGTYEFTATLPEGYELAESVAALILTVDLGGVEYQLTQDSDGYYQIYDALDFTDFVSLVASNSAANARLMNDIELSGSEIESCGPIGTDYTEFFAGVFDGQNFTVTISEDFSWSSSVPYAGIFGVINGGTVCNLNVHYLDYAAFSVLHAAGGLCGLLVNGTIENCHVVADDVIIFTDSSSTYSGGLVGSVGGGSYGLDSGTSVIRNCSVKADTDEYGTNGILGGLVGIVQVNEVVTISRCAVEGSFTGSGSYPVGGLIAKMYGVGYGSIVEYSYFAGMVANGYPAGGLIGESTSNTYSVNCCYVKLSADTDTSVRAFYGAYSYSSNPYLNDCFTNNENYDSDEGEITVYTDDSGSWEPIYPYTVNPVTIRAPSTAAIRPSPISATPVQMTATDRTACSAM